MLREVDPAELSRYSGSLGDARRAWSQSEMPRVMFRSTSTRVTPYQDMARGSRGAARWARSKAAWAPSRSREAKAARPSGSGPPSPPAASPAGSSWERAVGHRFRSWMMRRPSRVSWSSTSVMAVEMPATSEASPPVATTFGLVPSSSAMRTHRPSTSAT